MSYRISVSHEAQEDLRGIYAYIAFHLLAPKKCKRTNLSAGKSDKESF